MSTAVQTQTQQPVDKTEVRFAPFGTKDEIKLSLTIIKNFVAVKTKSGATCSDQQAMRFLMLAKAQRLDPFVGDCFLIGYDKRNKDGTYTPTFSMIVAHQAFLKRAEVSDEYEGMESGIILADEFGSVTEREGDFKMPSENVVGGWARVYRKGRKPTYRRLSIASMMPAYETPFWSVEKAPGQIVKCFDEETEVLTSLGFEKFANAEGQILQVTPAGLMPTDSIPFFQPYAGPMIHWGSRNGNFAVTPNHDIPVSLNGTPERKMEAGKLLNLKQLDEAVMPMILDGSCADNVMFSDNIIRLAAAYIADGSDNSASSGFSISVSRKEKVKWLKELGMQCSSSVRNDAGKVATLSSGRKITTVADKTAFYYSRTAAFTALVGRGKEINHTILLSFSARQSKLLVDSWMDFDGNRPSSMKSGRVYMSRPGHVRSFELAAVIAGYSVSKPKPRASEGGTTNYCLSITDRASIRLHQQQLSSVQNTGSGVWCVKVPSGKIIVRRNGFSAISHNCAESDALRSTFPTLLGGMYITDEMPMATVVDVSTVKESKLVANAPQESEPSGVDEPATQQRTTATEKPKSAQDSPNKTSLAKSVLDAGFSFDQFQRWGIDSENVPNAASMASFDDIPEDVAKRLMRAVKGLLASLGQQKEVTNV